jgi:tripartite-type tricarboxylate transporter receptor subunit TctC
MLTSWARLAGAAVVSGLLTLTATAQAQAPNKTEAAEAAYFRGKTVRLVVGYGAGGGYDVYARMIAPHISRYLGASIIVENQPGAGGLSALNTISIAPPDGLHMMIVNGAGAALAQLLNGVGVRYDLAKLGHLGTVAASPWIWLVAPQSRIKTPADALNAGREIMWSATGTMDGLADGAQFTCEALQMKCKVVMGYNGSNQAALAVTSGEMDSIYVSDTSANNYVKSGQSRAVAAMARKRSRFFPDVPTIFELAKLTPDQAWLFDFRANIEDLGRILVVPPGMAPERLVFMQDAVKKALTDATVIAEGERTQRYIDFQDAETTRKRTLSVVADATSEQKARVKSILDVK